MIRFSKGMRIITQILIIIVTTVYSSTVVAQKDSPRNENLIKHFDHPEGRLNIDNYQSYVFRDGSHLSSKMNKTINSNKNYFNEKLNSSSTSVETGLLPYITVIDFSEILPYGNIQDDLFGRIKVTSERFMVKHACLNLQWNKAKIIFKF
jgi:hypothetical protein